MTASDHCSSREKTLANRGPSTHEAALAGWGLDWLQFVFCFCRECQEFLDGVQIRTATSEAAASFDLDE